MTNFWTFFKSLFESLKFFQGKWKNKFVTNALRMERAFKRNGQKCGFFNPESEHGGPQRRRRSLRGPFAEDLQNQGLIINI